MDLKMTLKRAQSLSWEQGADMVVGDDDGWIILPLDDPRSDSLSPGIIVNSGGIKYPEDHDTAVALMAQGK